jgi:hypothetical protein
MKNTISTIILIIVFIIIASFDKEPKTFDVNNFPTEKYSILIDSIEHNYYSIKIILVSEISNKAMKQLWIGKTIQDIHKIPFMIEPPQLIGKIDLKNSVFYIKKHPFIDKSIFILDGQINKNVLIIQQWDDFLLPGNQIAISKDSFSIYTKGSADSMFYKYNFRLKKKIKLRKLPINENISFCVNKLEDKL